LSPMPTTRQRLRFLWNKVGVFVAHRREEGVREDGQPMHA